MRKALLVAFLVAFSGVGAVAQDDYHKFEVGAGWNYLHVDTGGVGTSVSEDSTSGLFIDGTFYARKWVGLTADFEYNQKSYPVGTLHAANGVDSNLLSLVFGPRFKGHYGRVEPFGHGLFGFSRVSVKPATGGVNTSDTAFAMKFGGGVDVGVARHFAVRLGEVNYYLTKFGTTDCFPSVNGAIPCGLNGKGTQNNFTFSTGIVIR